MDRSSLQNERNEEVQRELDMLSPLLAKVSKPRVPLPAEPYFEALAGNVLQQTVTVAKPKGIVRLWPLATASLAAAACITFAVVFWPVGNGAPAPAVAWGSVSNDELVQYALQDDELVETRLIEDAALLQKVSNNEHFHYVQPSGENEDLYWEIIDEETLMEDFL